MSGDRPLLPPLEPGTFRGADGTIRRFLVNPTGSSSSSDDRSTDSASERWYSVIRQFHPDFSSFNQHLSTNTQSTDSAVVRMASSPDGDLRPRFNRDPQPSNAPPPPAAASPASPSLPPLRFLDPRARASPTTFTGSGSRSSRYRPAGRYLDRVRSHLGTTLDDLNRNIHDTDALRALVDFANNPVMPRSSAAVSDTPNDVDMADANRRIKRRKLDTERSTPTYKGFRYGRYGQIEPGQLSMEIVSCDGGLYSDEHSYPPENILKNDSSVYCTKSNRCNIVLKHQGGTVFSLQELVIKAPGSKFSCPIREGMVFVSMELDDLLNRTAQYQIQYLPARSHRRGTVYFRHEEDGLPRIQRRSLRAYSYGADDDDEDGGGDGRTAQIPPEFTASPAPFNVTTVCSDDESDGEDHSSNLPAYRQATRQPARTLPFESDSDDEESIQIFPNNRLTSWPPVDEDEIDHSSNAAAVLRRRYRASRFHGGASSNSNQTSNNRSGSGSASASANTDAGGNGMTLEEAQEASQIATQEAVRAVGGELMAPLAHFFIEKDKNKCTVRFDPPVSARFILLKMWSTHQDPQKNIDIQAVVAKGFAGPRYCPAVELA
ncbi:hypothetical protein CHGG_03209 [Chaetomium globosum CBS 148.51]|uniref:Uncharacterized protein n=1 Tax=Chaetomium globosum (strain ATCC 6205 / CBS 148.51 / DSM 1962 / NBRC 6347 / NRRL 1970) TaxID=306901 RepID=Q2H995_CHAGB|nr:uncharacterized protein CHGG_03209 [Chaetomium globosum CBS 148.51]EAQ91274.1 hypothetical protein CHGG_03209 [Chaetomium globosum CBS 148.51]